jgi:hypothetical protein
VHGGALRFGSAVALNDYVEDSSASTPMQSGPMSRQTDSVEASSDNTVAMPASLNDVVLASAAAIRDIDGIMTELQGAEPVWRANAWYIHLAKTASASAKSITEIISQWLEHERFGSSRPPQTSADQERHPKAVISTVSSSRAKRQAILEWAARSPRATPLMDDRCSTYLLHTRAAVCG